MTLLREKKASIPTVKQITCYNKETSKLKSAEVLNQSYQRYTPSAPVFVFTVGNIRNQPSHNSDKTGPEESVKWKRQKT
jgi:CMP-N-acetylneuraminic acid synthetase